MSHHSHRTWRTSRPRLEIMESRELLSGIGARAHAAVEVSPLAKKPAHVQIIKGSLAGQGVVTSGGDLQGQESLMAMGQSPSLGLLTFSGQLNYQVNGGGGGHTVSYTGGSGTLTAQGGQIVASFSGSGKHTGPSAFSMSLKGSATGGTNAFARATGSFSGKGTIDDQSEAFSLSFTMKLSRH